MSQTTMWRAVVERDQRLDGSFVYAVATTGVYCRPSCPSRKPKRDNVRFYGHPAAAEAAGYRACRRCRPAAVAVDRRADLVRRAASFIDDYEGGVPSLAEIARAAGASPYHVQRTFSAVMGISPRAYAEALRAGRLRDRLRAGDDIAGALYEAGYGAPSRVYEKSDAHLGMTPATYRKGGAGATIGYTCADSPLGRLLVGATARGIAFVALGDSDAALEADLRAEFPAARLTRDDAGLGRWLATLLDFLAGQTCALDLPLDVCATAFQWRVWRALTDIPFGQTRTYKEIAEALGEPGAARAVGRACATNPAALVVPCHRALASDGAMRGYRWGLERKRRLLALERNRVE